MTTSYCFQTLFWYSANLVRKLQQLFQRTFFVDWTWELLHIVFWKNLVLWWGCGCIYIFLPLGKVSRLFENLCFKFLAINQIFKSKAEINAFLYCFGIVFCLFLFLSFLVSCV
jgi:hypothetical protein